MTASALIQQRSDKLFTVHIYALTAEQLADLRRWLDEQGVKEHK